MKFTMINLFLFLLFIMMIFISVLLTLAFLTLLERKLLGLIQLRKGPNKVGFLGIFQPFSDAIKLFVKENNKLLKFNKIMYLITPMIMIYLMLLLWLTLSSLMNFMFLNLMVLIIFMILGMGAYPIMLSGWSSMSIYALLGSLRSIVQSISYEISFMLLILVSIMFIDSFNLIKLYEFQKFMKFMIYLFVIMLMFFVSLLAELNRTPFDFSEGESELVSGFNVEYMGGEFALIFMSEYGMIVFMSFWLVVMYFFVSVFNLMFYVMLVYMSFLVVWVRGVFPRFRYDMMMYLIWKNYLPLVLFMFIYFYNMKFMLILLKS
uniref:NADH-ubiquinone oxidoreductase chain 1 n=1 Tax=Conostigmus sp. MM-2013 TaxID=1357450 RepID=V9NK67_9HYME|nr:NADH dehydrogenase subunit 1 [Conostigmus sp. MM-2013]